MLVRGKNIIYCGRVEDFSIDGELYASVPVESAYIVISNDIREIVKDLTIGGLEEDRIDYDYIKEKLDDILSRDNYPVIVVECRESEVQ